MAKYKHGPLGAFSGRLGPIVGLETLGGPTLRTYQGQVRDPKTARQLAERGRLKAVAQLSRQVMDGYIRPLWGWERGGGWAWALWNGANAGAFAWEPDPARPADLEAGRPVVRGLAELMLCRGEGVGTGPLQGSAAAGGALLVEWAAQVPGSMVSDLVWVLAWRPLAGRWLLQADSTKRSAGGVELADAGATLQAGEELWVWAGTLRLPGAGGQEEALVSGTERLSVVVA